MNEEKMMILNMLKEGKINEEEAAKLLDAIDNKTGSENNQNYRSKNKNWEKDFDNIMKKLEYNLNEFGEKFGEKMDKIGRDFSEGSESFTDKIMSSFNTLMEKDISTILGKYEIKNERLELEIDDIEQPSLDIRSINGSININPWSKDYIQVEAKCHLKKNRISKEETIMSLKKLDNNIILKPLYDSDLAVNLDISLPNKNYDNMRINTSNGKIDLIDLDINSISAFTTNASITLYDIKSPYINLSTKNGSVAMNNTISKKIDAYTKNAKIIINEGEADTINLSTSNSSILLENAKLNNLYAKNSNGKINLKSINPDSIEEVKLITSNAAININLKEITKAYKIEANTTNSTIELDLPNLVYDYNDKNQNIKAHKEATSVDEQIIFDLNTTNGRITID